MRKAVRKAFLNAALMVFCSANYATAQQSFSQDNFRPGIEVDIQVDSQAGRPVTILPDSAAMLTGQNQEPVTAPPRRFPSGVIFAQDTSPYRRSDNPDQSSRQTGTSTDNQSIEVETLGQVDPSAIGLLSDHNGGLGAHIWAGSDPDMIKRLLPSLEFSPGAPTQLSLARRLLLTAAEVPGTDNSSSPVTASSNRKSDAPSLLTLRLQRLREAGAFDEIIALTRIAPDSVDEPTIRRMRVEALLLGGNLSLACNEIKGSRHQADDRFWLKAMIFCRLVDGDTMGAGLGLDLLREGGEIAPEFKTLTDILSAPPESADKLAGKSADKTEDGISGNNSDQNAKTAPLDPLILAMMRAARQNVGSDTVRHADVSTLRTIAISPNADIETRLYAAEAAEHHGAITAELLRQIYASVNVSPPDRRAALQIAGRNPGPLGNAVLYHAALTTENMAERARLLRAAWNRGEKAGRRTSAIRANLPTLMSMQPSEAPKWFAREAIRALLQAARPERASEWFEFVRHSNKSLAANLAPLMLISNPERYGGPESPSPESRSTDNVLNSWMGQTSALSRADRNRQAALLFSLLHASGFPVGEDRWSALIDAPQTNDLTALNFPLLRGIAVAASAGRRGETVLLSLLALQSANDNPQVPLPEAPQSEENSDANDLPATESPLFSGLPEFSEPANIEPAALGTIISALYQVGLVHDARNLALEAAFRGGL